MANTVLVKRKKSVTQASRSTDWFRDHGYLVENVEHTIRIPDRARPGRLTVFKRDLWGAFDLIAVRKDGNQYGVTFCQATVGMGSHKTERMKKIIDSPATMPLLQSGNSIQLHLWRKMGKRGARKLWCVKRLEARIFDGGISWLELEEDDVEEAFNFALV